MIRCWCWPKVKVTRSKVKVKYAILWKYVFWLYIINQWLHIDDAHTQDKYCWDVEVDQRSRSKGQRSRSNIRFCKKLVSTIYQEQMNESWSKSYIGLISMRCWSWPKVKVTRSKVKVKYTIMWNKCFGYKLW